MSAELTIRPGSAADAAAVAEIWTDAYVRARTTPRRSPFTSADVISADAAGELIVATLDGAVVGAVVLLPHGHELGSITRGRDEEQINLLAVDAPARRRGVGRALLEECARRARARGHRALVLWTRPTHHEAPPLYESLGYARVPDRDSAPDGHPRVAYRLEL